ncbi:MAG: sulfatase [Verrucomicrobiia bacterium]|jgi:N-sulfoglucosamine sulfohydrolase
MKHKLLFFLLAIGTLALSATGSSAESRPPNVLLITADDLGCLLSCYGEKRIATPRLDALAASGVRFGNAYVAESSCSQSRAALLTGRWPHQNGLVGLSQLGFRMHPGQPTLPALLKAAGYRTGIIGKLHVEPAADFPFDWMPAKVRMAPLPTRNVRWVAEQSREFFASAKAADKPFFYYVNYFDPHVPLTKDTDQIVGLPEKPLTAADIKEPLPLGAPDAAKNRLATARLLNAVLRVDAGMGLLLDELHAAGFADNTIVIFVGDNGTAMPRGKTWSYETGVRVPMIVRWPGVAKPGQSRDELVSLLDVMPTLLAGVGVKAPDNLVGTALQPLLRGEPGGKDWREFLFTEENFHEPQMFRGQRSVRDARYKLLLNLVTSDHGHESEEFLDFESGGVNVGSLTAGRLAPVELFDLQTDPNETRNLADEPAHAATRKRLEVAIQAWREKRADPLLDPARVQRWKDAAARWDKLPRIKVGPHKIVRIPEGELELLK